MSELWSKTELKKYALRQGRDGIIISFVLHPDDVSKALVNAPIGTVYLAALVEKVDGAEPEPEKAAPAKKEVKPSLRMQACIACQDPKFWGFLSDFCEVGEGKVTSEEQAKQAVLLWCGIESRKELDTDEKAAISWRRLHTAYLAEGQV